MLSAHPLLPLRHVRPCLHHPRPRYPALQVGETQNVKALNLNEYLYYIGHESNWSLRKIWSCSLFYSIGEDAGGLSAHAVLDAVHLLAILFAKAVALAVQIAAGELSGDVVAVRVPRTIYVCDAQFLKVTHSIDWCVGKNDRKINHLAFQNVRRYLRTGE